MGERYFEGDQYFNPLLQLEPSEKKSKAEALLDGYRLTRAQVDKLRSLLNVELQLGLQNKPERPSAFPMVNTFVTQIPTGTEEGDFLGLDIGGSNLRVLHLNLSKVGGKYEKKIELEFYDVATEVRQGSGPVFFGFLASCIKDFVDKKNLQSIGKVLPLGFTFSFGYEQYAIDKGEIVQMGIQTNVDGVKGQCPVQFLQRHIDALQLPVKVVALANDATATLIYSIYLDQEATAGLILGSGTNVAYIENISRFGKISDANATFGYPVKEFAVNSEFPLFGDNGVMDFAKVKYDHELDSLSLCPKTYTYEKITGGAFLGELFRITLLDLAKNGLLLGGVVSEQLATESSIGSPSISLIEAEFEANGHNSRANKEAVALLIQLGYKAEQITEEDIALLTATAQLITIRSAIFIAAAVSIFVDHIERQVVKVGCDGSLFKKHPKMSKMINAYVGAFSPAKKTEVFSADQGSGIGVAMIAATVVHSKK